MLKSKPLAARWARVTLAGPAVVLAISACNASAPPIEDATYAFTHVNVIPMDEERVLEDQTVVIRDDRIVAIGPASEISVGKDAVTIDGEGKFLMPGLAEMHAHVPPVQRGSDAWPDRDNLDDILFLYIANGITSIRGMLGAAYQLELRDMLSRSELLGPNFYVGAFSVNGTSAPDPETAEQMIRDHKAAGYDLQKIHPGVSLETWDRMADVAREVGLTFGGHVPVDVGLEHAIETGMSTVDHIDGFIEAVTTAAPGASIEETFSSVDEERLNEIVDLVIEHDVYVVPTEYLWENLLGNPDPQERVSQPEMQYVSQQQRDAWVRQKEAQDPISDADAAAVATARRNFIRVLDERGAKLLMGTDSPQMFNVPGFALHREIRVMEEAGMSPFAVLVSGTRNVASYVGDHLGLENSFGTISVGNRADLVLLNGNPLETLDNLTARAGVMVRGQWLTAEELEAGLARIAEKHAAN